jgi:c-di-GMP-binding flagellar brake protein YcgR
MNQSNQRKHSRATVNLLAGETNRGRYYLPLLANISENGVYLESPTDLEMPRVNDPIVELNLPGIDGLIWARCRVVREENQGFFTGRALSFVDISAIDRKHIRLYVQRCIGIA